MRNKALSLLGIAHRAGQIECFEDANLAAVRKRQAKLLFLASDAGVAAAKKYQDKCKTYGIPLKQIFTKEELGKAIGKSPRTAVCVLDNGFAKRFTQLLANSDHIFKEANNNGGVGDVKIKGVPIGKRVRGAK